MFETCHHLTALNEERARLYQEPNANIIEINNWYNARKKLLTQSLPTYKKLEKFVYKAPDFPTIQGIPFAGKAPAPNMIVMTPQGFLC